MAVSVNDLSIPFGSTGEYVENAVSPRGGGIEFGGFIQDQISLAVGAAWNTFYKNVGRVTFTENNATITGRQYRYYNTLPVYRMIRYFFQPVTEKSLSPYVGVGGVAIYGKRRMDVGLFSNSEEGWQLGLFPEVGLHCRIKNGVGALLSGRYHHGFSSDDLPTISFLGINISLRFFLR